MIDATRPSVFDRRQEFLESDRIHDEGHERNIKRLQGFYGDVARRQNVRIVGSLGDGLSVDVGAGYGTLVQLAAERGKTIIGIEIDEKKIDLARQLYGIELVPEEFGEFQPTEQVEGVIFREVLNHLSFEEARDAIERVGAQRIIVFQGTENIFVKTMKLALGHHEYLQKTPETISQWLSDSGFEIVKKDYVDVIAFPLSGGWWSPCFVPNIGWIRKCVMTLESVCEVITKLIRVDRLLCYRVLIVAERR